MILSSLMTVSGRFTHLGIPLLFALALPAACGTEDSPDPVVAAPVATTPQTSTTAAAATTPSTTITTTTPVETRTNSEASAVILREVQRGERYCEVLLVRPGGDTLSVEVWLSYPRNDCPARQWESLDFEAIAAEADAAVALPNGPRFWLMDRIERWTPIDPVTKTFGGIEMSRGATVEIASLTASAPYVPVGVNRSTVFVYEAGTLVYQLTDPGGAVYVMQSWSQQIDPSIELDSLAQLGSRLDLPDGWFYGERQLDAALRVETIDRDAQVLQDEYRNSYSLVSD
jgi:hypothetical protein